MGRETVRDSEPVFLDPENVTELAEAIAAEIGGAGGGGLTDTELRATPVPVSGTVAVSGGATAANQATQITAEQAILAKIIAAPATEAKQDNGNTTLTSISGKLPATLGPTTAANSLSIAPASNASFAVTGTFWQATQPVSGTFWQATQPVSGTFWQATQPVSGTVTANIGTIAGISTEATLAAMSGKLPASLGIKAAAASFSIAPASDSSFVVQPALPADQWQYAAAASGIVNSASAVTIKAAAGASVRNYIDSIQIMHEVLTNATEFAIRDGAAGAVIWRTKIPAGVAGVRDIAFRVPLKGTANTLLEVLTLSASGAGAVYFDAQGHTGA